VVARRLRLAQGLLVDIGDSVERNQVVAVLDDEQFTRQVQQATAELQVAKANVENSTSDLDLAKREYERVTPFAPNRSPRRRNWIRPRRRTVPPNAIEGRSGPGRAEGSFAEGGRVAVVLHEGPRVLEGGDPNRVVGERFVDEGALVSVNQQIVSILENNPLTAVVFVIERDYPR